MAKNVPILVVLGIDIDGKPHASRFDERDAPADADALAARTGDWELLTRLRCRRWMRDTVSGRPGPTPAPQIAGGDGREWSPELGVLLVASAASRGDEALALSNYAYGS